jgi:pSer/pThr/pTyr-binding forkhead associated (FHA) protein
VPTGVHSVSELTLFILRLAFLAALWVFVFIVVYALRSDLFGQRVRRLAVTPTTPDDDFSSVRPARNADVAIATRLVITTGAKEGLEIPLTGELFTIGRSSDSSLVIRDDYTSTNHARLILGAKGWMIEDLNSTNGTKLRSSKVKAQTFVPLNTPVTIGTTTFELRR